MGIITFVLGIAVVLNREVAFKTVITGVGIVLIVVGAISLIGFLFDKRRGVISYVEILIGIIVMGIGLVLIITPDTFIPFLSVIFAIILALHGVMDVVQGFVNKKLGDTKWTHSLFIGLICILLAVFIFFNPFNAPSVLMLIIGISLILDGATLVLISGRAGLVLRRYNKAVQEEEKVASIRKAVEEEHAQAQAQEQAKAQAVSEPTEEEQSKMKPSADSQLQAGREDLKEVMPTEQNNTHENVNTQEPVNPQAIIRPQEQDEQEFVKGEDENVEAFKSKGIEE